MMKFEHEINQGKEFLYSLEQYLEREPVKELEKYKKLYFGELEKYKQMKKVMERKLEEAKMEVARLGLKYGSLMADQDETLEEDRNEVKLVDRPDMFLWPTDDN